MENTSETQPFFSQPENLKITFMLINLFDEIKSKEQDRIPPPLLLKYETIKEAALFLNSHNNDDITCCLYSTESSGKAFIECAKDVINKNLPENKERLDELFIYSYQFIIEIQFNSENPIHKIDSLISKIIKNIDQFETSIRQDITYINHSMPLRLAKALIHHENVKEIKKIYSSKRIYF
jgi:hypothetical protein